MTENEISHRCPLRRWLFLWVHLFVNNSAVAEPTDKELIVEVLSGQTASFEPLVVKYQPRVFAIARRYARRENEGGQQTVFLKAFSKLSSYKGTARLNIG